MKLEKWYARKNDITEQQKAFRRFSDEWNALEKERMKVVVKIHDLTGWAELHDSIRVNAGRHIEGTAL